MIVTNFRGKKFHTKLKDKAIGASAARSSSSSSHGSSGQNQNRWSTDEMTESEDSDYNRKQAAKAENGTRIEDRMNLIESKVEAVEKKIDAIITMVSKLVDQKDA